MYEYEHDPLNVTYWAFKYFILANNNVHFYSSQLLQKLHFEFFVTALAVAHLRFLTQTC